MTETNRITLRELPLAARLVLSVFLISVGIGYISAMVQIHFKHAGKGDPMPTPGDLVAHFSGREWPLQPPEPEPEPEKKTEVVKIVPPAIAGNETVPGGSIKMMIDTNCASCHAKDGEKGEPLLDTWDGVRKLTATGKAGKFYKVIVAEGDKWSKDNMRQSFTTKHPDWKDDIKERPEAQVRAEHEVERLTLIAWIEAGAKEEYYGDGKFFPIPETAKGKPITKALAGQAQALPKVVDAGVVGGKPEGEAPAKKKKSFKGRQISIESLTQSTHAHLLAFSVLWTVLGLTFAFTSYPMWLRCTVAPVVLIAQVLDIGFWWLARLEGIGPYFALGIMATGAVVGLGVLTQIVLGLFNMYGKKGRAVLVLLAVLFAAGGGLVAVKVVLPQLEAEKLERTNEG